MPWTEYPRPFGSFEEPIPLITADPSDLSDQVTVCFNRAYLQVVIGSVSQLTQQATWATDDADEFFAMQERIFLLMSLFGYGDGCVDACCPIFQTDPATGLPEVSYDDGLTFTKFPAGAYNPDETAPYASPPPPLDKGDEDADRCFAAWNAASVIAEFYKQTVGQVAAGLFNAVLSVNMFLYQLNQALLKLVYPSEAQIAQAIGFFNFDFGSYATAPTLDDDQMDALRCLLYDNATETGGVVGFDFAAVTSAVIDTLGVNPGTAVLLLLNYMDTSGLNYAGGVQSNATADCEDCNPPPPCVDISETFDTGLGVAVVPGVYGFTAVWDGSLGHDSAGCLQATDTTSRPGNRSGSVAFDLGQNCDVTGFSFWYKTSHVGAAAWGFMFQDHDGNTVDSGGDFGIPGSNDLQWHFVSKTGGWNAQYLSIYWVNNQPGYACYLDDMIIDVM